jgi:hypothetical protein
MSRAAARVALLVCDDLLAAVEVLRRTELNLSTLDGAALLRAPLVATLARSWVSAEADAIRRRLGIAEPTRTNTQQRPS